MRTQKFDDEKRKLGALALAKTFRLVAFQFQCSIIQSWENVQSTKKKNKQTNWLHSCGSWEKQ